MRPIVQVLVAVTAAMVIAVMWERSSLGQFAERQAPQTPGVYVVPLDGGSPVLVGGPLASAVWSPNGTALAVVESPSAGTLSIAQASNGDALVVDGTVGAMIGAPRWSPDGTRLAYTVVPNTATGGQPGLYVVQASGQGPGMIARGVPSDFTWTPDGAGITLVQQTMLAGPAAGYENSIVTIDAATGATQTVILPLSGSICPRDLLWSPDAAYLAYFVGGVQNDPCANEEARGLWMWDAATAASRQIAQGTGLGLQWLPDGTILVQFMGLAIYRPDGALLRTLVADTGGTLADAPAEAAGRVALYSQTMCNSAAVFAVDLAGGVPEKLSDYSVYAYSPRLSPDGSEVVWATEGAGGTDLTLVALDGRDPSAPLTGAPGMTVLGWSPAGDAITISVQSMPERPFFCGGS